MKNILDTKKYYLIPHDNDQFNSFMNHLLNKKIYEFTAIHTSFGIDVVSSLKKMLTLNKTEKMIFKSYDKPHETWKIDAILKNLCSSKIQYIDISTVNFSTNESNLITMDNAFSHSTTTCKLNLDGDIVIY